MKAGIRGSQGGPPGFLSLFLLFFDILSRSGTDSFSYGIFP